MMRRQNTQTRATGAKGFTVIEVLVVVVVIAILAVITVVSYSGISANARWTAKMALSSNIQDQIGAETARANGVTPDYKSIGSIAQVAGSGDTYLVDAYATQNVNETDPASRVFCGSEDIRDKLCVVSPDWSQEVYAVAAYNDTKKCWVTGGFATKKYLKDAVSAGMLGLTPQQADDLASVFGEKSIATQLANAACTLGSREYPYYSSYINDSSLAPPVPCLERWPQIGNLLGLVPGICD